MAGLTTRRNFIRTAAAGGAFLGLGDLGFLSRLPAVSAAETELDPKLVRLRPEIEPLVRTIETTPRERVLEVVAEKIRHGTSYQEVLAALLLTGVRNVQPRPSVGHKFHSVLVVNSAHLASLSSPDSDRWLPIFWAIDYTKRTQAEEERTSGWKLGPVDEKNVPPAHKAKAALIDALDRWDEAAADVAAAGFVRAAGAAEVFEVLYRYGMRDFRSIGHKAIYVANSQRTLSCIGWQHAEPVVRSLVYALLNHQGDANPAKADLAADRPFRENSTRVKKISAEWRNGKPDDKAARELIGLLHAGSGDEACDLAVEMLARGVAPQSLWDAALVGSAELLMRQPGIVPLHAMTTSNALHYAHIASGDDETRQLALLQNLAFVALFRGAAEGRGRIRDRSIDDVTPVVPEGTGTAAVEEIFADVSGDRDAAAAKVRGFIAGGGDAKELIDAARRLTFLKGNDAHDYKFSSAALEDYYHVSPAWRDQYLALSVYNLDGTGSRDNDLVQRTRAALA
ncbi:MAG: hypothetical protein WD066_14000 [Planctomycetaceae bacterium]